MNYAESYVQYLCKWLLDHCQEEIEFMVKSHDKDAMERLELVSSTPFERISYTKAVEILKDADRKFDNKVEWGIDLASEHERYGYYNRYCHLSIIFGIFGFEIVSCNLKVFD
jgi:asparaginyl-tRNA synthetase